MDDNADVIQRCINRDLKHQVENQVARTWNVKAPYNLQPTGNFSRWIKILEVGTFNPIERLVIKAALYKHKREATKKIICSTLVDGEYTSKEEEKDEEDYRDHPDPEMDEYCGQLEGHLKGYPGYEDEPIHPHLNLDYGDEPTQELEEILKDFGEENQCK